MNHGSSAFRAGNVPVGIDDISFYIPRYALDLQELARARGYRSDKFKRDLGQDMMSLIPPNEDIVTMGVNAALPIVDRERAKKIKMVLFATESAVDQAKAAGIYVQHFLGLPSDCRVVELKQACYSLTAALQLARGMIALQPDAEVLIIGADVAKYELKSVAEATQGAGAVAMIVSQNPSLLALDPFSGVFTRHVMDFWRPPYSEHAFVSPQYSVHSYIKAMDKAWVSYQKESGLDKDDIDFACYHTPFARMAKKVHKKFRGNEEQACKDISPAIEYGKIIGNTYTAALYISLCSLLENNEQNLAGKRIGLFSYGSGAVSEYFSGVIQENYKEKSRKSAHQALLSHRDLCDIKTYEEFYHYNVPRDGKQHTVPDLKTGPLAITGFSDHKRHYEWTQESLKSSKEKVLQA